MVSTGTIKDNQRNAPIKDTDGICVNELSCRIST